MLARHIQVLNSSISVPITSMTTFGTAMDCLILYFIVEIILQAKDILGIQYLFLFAADLSDDGSLVGFYKDHLNFQRDAERATVKPIYDLSCEFMYQETKYLAEKCQEFFDNFNSGREE